MRTLFLTCFILLVTLQVSFAQSRTLRGEVLDVVTHEALSGATINFLNLGDRFSTLTNESGAFVIEEVPLGRHTIEVNYLGYGTKVLPGVLIEGGQQEPLQIWMTPTSQSLTEFVVSGSAGALNALTTLGLETFSIEETERFAGSFYDPARLITNFPGVVNTNDQANGFSVRGNNPDANSWRLEGVEIVNPNHTPNAGTFNDQTTLNAGGVLILSGQMLDNSALLKGAYPAAYGNALGGVLDLYLKKGNPEVEEQIYQAGLIGLDAAGSNTLGNTDITLTLNARYSFTGILGLLGVDFGGETISFYDAATNVHFPDRGAGEFTLFTVFGSSSNVFEVEEDPDLWEESKDRFDIDYNNDVGIIGTTHEIRVGTGRLRTALAWSRAESFRTSTLYGSNLQPFSNTAFSTSEQKISGRSEWQTRLGARTDFRLGVMLTQQQYGFGSVEGESSRSYSGVLIEPYASADFSLTDKLSLTTGLRYVNFTADGQSGTLEPRAAVSFQSSARGKFSAALGYHSALQNPYAYLNTVATVQGFPNLEQPLRKSRHLSLGYEHFLSNTSSISAEIFHQQLSDILVPPSRDIQVSTINAIGGFYGGYIFTDAGTGENFGVELSYRRYLAQGWYYLANATVFESTFTDATGLKRDTRWATNYIGNFAIGKEWTKVKDDGKQRVFGVNARALAHGGYRDAPIDEFTSFLRRTTIYSNPNPLAELPEYFRADLRLYIRWEKAGRSSMLSLDVQNVSNRRNIAFERFDGVQNDIVAVAQLGLIPVLNWRLELSK